MKTSPSLRRRSSDWRKMQAESREQPLGRAWSGASSLGNGNERTRQVNVVISLAAGSLRRGEAGGGL